MVQSLLTWPFRILYTTRSVARAPRMTGKQRNGTSTKNIYEVSRKEIQSEGSSAYRKVDQNTLLCFRIVVYRTTYIAHGGENGKRKCQAIVSGARGARGADC